MFSIALIAVPDLSGKEHPLTASRSCGMPATATLELGVSVSSRAVPWSRVSDLSGRRASELRAVLLRASLILCYLNAYALR